LFVILFIVGVRDYKQRAGGHYTNRANQDWTSAATKAVPNVATSPNDEAATIVPTTAATIADTSYVVSVGTSAVVSARMTEVLGQSDELSLENLPRLFQPRLMLDGGNSRCQFLSTMETCPPVNLNFDGNWNFYDTPSNIRLQMLNRPESLRKFYLTGGTVYYLAVRFAARTISHQYWYYFPVGKGRYFGTADQRIGLVEVVQLIPDNGLWGRSLTNDDIKVESVYVAGCLELDDLAGTNVKKYLPEDIEWSRFRPVIYVEKGEHSFSAAKNNIETWVDYKGKHSQSFVVDGIDWLNHPAGHETVINLSHMRDWNNPVRDGKNVNNVVPEGSFWEHGLYVSGSYRIMQNPAERPR
jgi:hypothetical protein